MEKEINTQRNKNDLIMELTYLHVQLAKESGNPLVPEELEELYLKYASLVQYAPDIIAQRIREKNKK